MEDSKLKQYFKFDEVDLQANRTGQLSEKQKGRVAVDEQYNKKWRLIGGALLLLLAAIGPFSIVSGWLNQGDLTFPFIFGGIWTLIFGIMSIGLLRRALSTREIKPAKIEGHAAVVEGYWYSASTKRKNIRHELHIGGKRFLTAASLAEIMNGKSYTLYFIDRALEHPADTSYLYSSDDILSVEEQA